MAPRVAPPESERERFWLWVDDDAPPETKMTTLSATLRHIKSFRDGYLPFQGVEVKDFFESIKASTKPDLILTHHRHDRHQDHRMIAEMTWNTFRDHNILEYEIPKWDGDIGQPNVYVPVSAAALKRKIELLIAHFGSQRSKKWFDDETFRGLARIRGMECCAPERYADLQFDHFFLQPMDSPEREENTRAATEYCLAHPQWRLSLQTHKLIGIR